MQLRHLKTVKGTQDLVNGQFQKVVAVCWSANNMKMAVATADRYVTLYDENGEQRDKFATKSASKTGSRNYMITALEFSPCSTKLAIAQTDNIVFIYKLGLKWGEKKSICNKFSQTAAVTAMCWPFQRPNEVVFGVADGKVRAGILKTNKSGTLYNTDTCVVSMACSVDGQSFVSGHTDGSIYRYSFPDIDGKFGASQALVVQAKFVPTALAWGEHICAAGNASLVQMFTASGEEVKKFKYKDDPKCKDFTVAAANPSGHTIVVGNFDSFYTFVYKQERDTWAEAGVTEIQDLYSITALRWKADGSRLVTGSLCGAVDFYDACVRRFLYNGKFEFTYTSPSSVIVKRLENGARMSLKSRLGLEIKKLDIYHDRFIVAHTPETLLVGELESCNLSEVPWTAARQSHEKFHFENPVVCMVYHDGELTLIEYGQNEILGSCRTEHMKSHDISVRIHQGNVRMQPIKRIAYLLDMQAARVQDLLTGNPIATINHDLKIDWLELNQRADKLLFRDKRGALHLYDIENQARTTLLQQATFVQWVPDSDVVVAQTRRQMCVWYNIHAPDQMTATPINGDIEDIEVTASGSINILVDEGNNVKAIPLDQSLIAFSTAVDQKNFEKAVVLLEKTPKSDKGALGMWHQLALLSFEQAEYVVAERCFAATGDVAKASFMRKINELVEKAGGNKRHATVEAQLALLAKQFKRAEMMLRDQGNGNAAIVMYSRLHKRKDAFDVAEAIHHPQLTGLRQEHFDYLMSTKQEEIAGELKEKEGDYATALRLYLAGGFPVRAANLVLQQRMTQDSQLTERVVNALLRSGGYEKAGEFLEALKQYERAVEAYCKGKAYAKACEISKRHFPAELVRLELEWGDHLVSIMQFDAACNHYIQAGSYLKAVNAAIEARQWSKAVQILDQIPGPEAQPFLRKIALHFAEQKNYALAAKYFVQAEMLQECVHMYTSAGMWVEAHKIARTFMTEDEVQSMYLGRAQKLQADGKYKEAEKLFLQVNQPDMAIDMYKRNRQFDNMLELIKRYRKDYLVESRVQLAQQFEREKNFKQAESHFVGAGEWKGAVQMYRDANLWEDSMRVAKQHGNETAYKQVAYAYAMAVGGDAGINLLKKKGLGEQAVDYAIERGEFPEAFSLCEKLCPHKAADVHLQYAMALEDESRFERAEEEFLLANKPKEAVDMYVHQQNWSSALRVAHAHDPTQIPEIHEAQGRQALENNNLKEAEQHFINAKKPGMAVKMYKEQSLWNDAARVAKTHAPHLVNEVESNYVAKEAANTDVATSIDYLLKEGKQMEKQRTYSRAIDSYLKITQAQTNDMDALEGIWIKAARLAEDYEPSRLQEVVTIVASRLAAVNRNAAATALLVRHNLVKEAIDICVKALDFERAKDIANQRAPQFLPMLEQAQHAHLIAANQLDSLGQINAGAALEVLVAQGNWDKVFEQAAKEGTGVVQRYAVHYASILIKDRKFVNALEVFVKYGAPCVPAHYNLYRRLAHDVLAQPRQNLARERSMAQVDLSVLPDGYAQLRQVLYSLVTELAQVDPHGDDTKQLTHLLQAVHYGVQKVRCLKQGWKELAAKCAVSVLRYTTDVPVDQAFFEAGLLNAKAGQQAPGFVFFNRFVDLTDLISDPDSGDIDNSDFTAADIPSPFDVPLPTEHNYSEDVREEVRNWVLEKAMSYDVGASLQLRPCDKCHKHTFVGSTRCVYCQNKAQPCVVTGFPVVTNRMATCSVCKSTANKDDWNTYVEKIKSCPWCDALQHPTY